MNIAVLLNISILFCMVTLMYPEGVKAEQPSSLPITILLNRATSLMNAGKADEAFFVLAHVEDELAGNGDYDYLFGVAALESGHPVKASLSLERVLAAKPDFAGARMDLGRAYFDIGNYLKARQEFMIVSKLPDPPPLVTSAISRYMAMIEKRLSKKKNQLSGWVEISGGYDSNVNYSTDDQIIEVPAFASAAIILSDENVEQDDAFWEFGVNMGLLHQFSPIARSYVGIEGSKRLLAKKKEFEKEDVNVRTYLEFGETVNTFRIGATAGLSTLDQSENSRQAGGSIQWHHIVNASNAMALFGQYDAFRYPDVKNNNVDRWVGGVSWLHALPFIRKALVAASAFGGYAHETENRADGDNSMYGLRLGYQMKPFSTVSIVAGVGKQFSDYTTKNDAFEEERNDKQLDAILALNWTPFKRVSLGCELSYIHNDSNIPIYEYKRNEVSAKVRYCFF